MKNIVVISLLLVLSACQVRIEPTDPPSNNDVAPEIVRVLLDGRTNAQDEDRVATRATDKFSLEVSAKNYTTVTLNVRLNNGGVLATQSCPRTQNPCSLTFPADRNWTTEDTGVYTIDVKAVNGNNTVTSTYENWVTVQLSEAAQ